jgi:hypothetical protein
MAYSITEILNIQISPTLCAKCLQPINILTGKNNSPIGEICDDCYYSELDDEIENTPIGRLK